MGVAMTDQELKSMMRLVERLMAAQEKSIKVNGKLIEVVECLTVRIEELESSQRCKVLPLVEKDRY